MRTKTKLWLRGLLAAFIGGAAGAATLGLLLPDALSWLWLGKVVLAFFVNGIVGVCMYLKKSPMPEPSTGNTDILAKDNSI